MTEESTGIFEPYRWDEATTNSITTAGDYLRYMRDPIKPEVKADTTTNFKVGDNVFWKRILDEEGNTLQLNKIDEKYQILFKQKKVLTIVEIRDTLHYIDEKGFESSPLFGSELEIARVTNWKKEFLK